MIREAGQRVIYAAPSVTDEVAGALIHIYSRLGDQCTVVLDYDEQIFRLGYGDNDAVDMLFNEGVPVLKQSGLRIGCLIVDNQGWMFALLPMSVESQVKEGVINAIELNSDQIGDMLSILPCKINGNAHKLSTIEIGQQILEQEEVRGVSDAIKSNPPQAFDLQRKVHIYQAHLQFVEVELEGGRIGQRTIRLPKELKEALLTNDKKINNRLNANYKLINSDTPSELVNLRETLYGLLDDCAPCLGKRLGRVLLLSRKKELNYQLIEIKTKLDNYRKSAIQSIQDDIETSLKDLAISFASRVMESPPPYLKGRCSKVTIEIAEEYILDLLLKEAPSAESLLDQTNLHYVFKDVTLEMLENKEFQQKVAKEFKFETWPKPFLEFTAAKSR